MFGQQQQPQPAQVRTYDPNAVAQTFYQNVSFGLGHPYDGISAPISAMLVTEIQQQALAKHHPVRIGMFNIMQEQDFNNQMFKDLLQVTMVRLAHSVANREFGDLDNAARNTIPRIVRACACNLVSSDQAFVQSLPADDVKGINEGNQIWQHVVRLMRGQEQFIPFNQLAMANQFPSTSPTTQTAMALASGIQNQNTNLFNVSGQTNFTATTQVANGNNDAPMGPYAAKRARTLGILQGSMQKSLIDVGLSPSEVKVDLTITAEQKTPEQRAAIGNALTASMPAQYQAQARKASNDNKDYEVEWGIVFAYRRVPNPQSMHWDGFPHFVDGGPPRSQYERDMVEMAALRLGLNPKYQDYGQGYDPEGNRNEAYDTYVPLIDRMRQANGGVGAVTYYSNGVVVNTTDKAPAQPVPQSTTYAFKVMDEEPEPEPAVPAVDPTLDPKSPEHAEKYSIHRFTANGRKYYVMMRLSDEKGRQMWAPSELQRFHPIGCKRTADWGYVICQCGTVIFVKKNLSTEQIRKNMDYDAHGIDPTKGHAVTEETKKPVVKEEAAVLYTNDVSVGIKIVNMPNIIAMEDLNSAIRSVSQSAALSDDKPNVLTATSTVNTPVFYEEATEVDDDVVVINAIGTAPDFVKAISLMSEISNRQTFDMLNNLLTSGVKNAMVNELGIDVSFDGFYEDCAEMIAAVEHEFGQLYAEKLKAMQANILMTYARASSGVAMSDYANSVLTVGEDLLPDSKLAKILFFTHNVVVAWTTHTAEELEMTVLPGKVGEIKLEDFPALFRMAEAAIKSAGTAVNSEFYFITRDGLRYRLHRSGFEAGQYLISQPK